jgi:hypothetical protein
MTDERERVERLVREGKASEEEGRKLIAALDDAERREARPAPSKEAAMPPEARGGSAVKRPGIFSRPLGLLLAGIAIVLIGGAVHSALVSPIVESFSAGVGELDLESLNTKLGEASHQLGRAWLWAWPFYIVGYGLIVVGIFKFIVRMVVREARKT